MKGSTETMCEEPPWSGEVVDFLANGGDYVVDFDRVPEIGTRIKGRHGATLELIAVLPYRRRDGSPSPILIWEDLFGGYIRVTGLRGKATSGLTREILDMIIGEIK